MAVVIADDLLDVVVDHLPTERPEGDEVHLEFLLDAVTDERRRHWTEFTLAARVVVEREQDLVAFVESLDLVEDAGRER